MDIPQTPNNENMVPFVDVQSESGNIKGIAYHPDTQQLWIKFAGKNGSESIYLYESFPAGKADEFIATAPNANDSTGTFFHAQIKGQYEYRKVS